jgi:hypothetical protein
LYESFKSSLIMKWSGFVFIGNIAERCSIWKWEFSINRLKELRSTSWPKNRRLFFVSGTRQRAPFSRRLWTSASRIRVDPGKTCGIWNGTQPDATFRTSESKVISCHCLKCLGSWAAVGRGLRNTENSGIWISCYSGSWNIWGLVI